MNPDMQYELVKMKIGERVSNGTTEFMKVPGGWVVSHWGYPHPDLDEPVVTSSCFVQEPITISNRKKKSQLVTLS